LGRDLEPARRSSFVWQSGGWYTLTAIKQNGKWIMWEKNAIEEEEEGWDEMRSTDPLLCIRPMVSGFGRHSTATMMK
jgi:hypothetical protein